MGRCEDRRWRFRVKPGMTEEAFPKRETFGDTEGGGDVAGLLVHGEAGLGAGAACPDEEVRPARRESQTPGQAGSDGFPEGID